jgi:hypothetical protein
MGASGRTWLTCRMEEEHYNELELYRFPEIQVLSIEPEFDYSFDDEWKEYKKEAGIYYKKRKERELYLRKQNGL